MGRVRPLARAKAAGVYTGWGTTIWRRSTGGLMLNGDPHWSSAQALEFAEPEEKRDKETPSTRYSARPLQDFAVAERWPADAAEWLKVT